VRLLSNFPQADGRLLYVYLQQPQEPKQKTYNFNTRGGSRNARSTLAPRTADAMDVDMEPIDVEAYVPSNGHEKDEPSRKPRAPQFQDGKYGFAENGKRANAGNKSNRPFTSNRGRGSHGGLASDAMMRDEQSSTNRRSNW
jgi:hypothetical protein